MNEFLLIFRRDFTNPDAQPSDDQLQVHLQHWQEWFGSLVSQDRLARQLQRWDGTGRILKDNKGAINGPYAEIKESIGGLIILKAKDYEDAVEIAKGCPILELGGSVELRMAL